jgi:hypothetical protein
MGTSWSQLSGVIMPKPNSLSTHLTVPAMASVKVDKELKARVILKRCIEYWILGGLVEGMLARGFDGRTAKEIELGLWFL